VKDYIQAIALIGLVLIIWEGLKAVGSRKRSDNDIVNPWGFECLRCQRHFRCNSKWGIIAFINSHKCTKEESDE